MVASDPPEDLDYPRRMWTTSFEGVRIEQGRDAARLDAIEQAQVALRAKSEGARP